MDKITWDELFKNSFNPKTLSQLRLGKISNTHGVDGPYIIQLEWDKEGLPFNQQIVWLFYHPTSLKIINDLFKDIRNTAKNYDGKIVIIDNYNSEKKIIPTILMLSDGIFYCNSFTLTFKDGIEGHLGYISGQNRNIETDPGIPPLIHAIVSNILGSTNELQKDKFLEYGKNKLKIIEQYIEDNELDLRIKSMGIEEIREGKI